MDFSFLTKHLAQKYARRSRRFKGKGAEVQQIFNDKGLYFLPRDVYCSLPSVKEIESSFEYQGEGLPWHDPALFDRDRLLAFLKELEPFAREFDPPREGHFDQPERFYWDNGFFGGADALTYYSILRRYQPARVLEIGSGFSTLLAAEALKRNGRGDVVCIEPYPRAFLKNMRLKELIQKPAQDMTADWFNDHLQDGDVLFIDSTHTVKTGGDCLYLYLKILPQLKAKVFIHSHDIFLPEAMPKEWQLKNHWYFNEQYLLYALLLGNANFEVLYGTNYHRRVNPEAFAAYNGSKSKPEGGSFWYRRV